MLGYFAEKFRFLGVLFIPCLLLGCLPPLGDTWMMTSFVLSQVVYYTLRNVKGMLLLATLVLVLWTKNIMKRWYTKQMLTREFFGKLLYMGLTGLLSVVAVSFVWVPLYDAFACALNKLDVATGSLVMSWRDHLFAVIAFAMAASTVASSDIHFLRMRSRRIANQALRRLAASSQSSDEMSLHEPLTRAETSPSSDSVIFSTSTMLRRSVCPRFSKAATSAARLSASRWSSNSSTSQATQSCASAESGTSIDEASNSSATDRAGPATRARPGPPRRGRKTVVLDPAASSPMTRSRTRMLGLETRLGSAGHRRSARDRKQK